MVYNGYYKVMSNIPKMGHLPNPCSNPVLSKEPRLGILPLPHCAEGLATGPRGRRACRGRGRWRLAGGHDLEGQGGNQRHSPEDVEDDGVVQVPF